MTEPIHIKSIDPIGYRPLPPLDLDLRPISGGRLMEWRKRQYSDGGRLGYPSQQQVAAALGVEQTTWGAWERGEMAGWHAALFREWARSGGDLVIPRRRATEGEVAALCAVLGGYRELCDTLDVEPVVARRWLATCGEPGGAPARKGTGPLVAWLVEDMRLEPADDYTRQDVGLRGQY